ncbi:MAG: multidrug effflux MFS transporter [Gemmatimonadaceae bacterium]
MREPTTKSAPSTLLLGSLVTLASFATDMGLPVLAATAASLHVQPATAALTMSIFMAGFAVGPLVMAPISDRHGRRRFLLLGCGAFALFGTLGAFATSLGALLAWRFIMGAGAGTVQVLVVATVRDYFGGREARVRQSYVNLAAGVAPIIAPTLGVWIAALGGWRAIYGALAGGGVVLFLLVFFRLREADAQRSKAFLTVKSVLHNYARVFRNPVSLGYAIVVALCFGCLFAYVSGSSLVLIGLMGISAQFYGVLFAATSLGLVAGSLLNARLNRRGLSHQKLIAIGLVVIASTSLTLFALSFTTMLQPTILISMIIISHVGHAVVRANSVQGALEPLPDIAGVTSAVVTGMQMVVGASTSAIAATLFDGHSAIAMTGTMSLCAVGALSTYLFVVRPAERKRAKEKVGDSVMAEADFVDVPVEVG